MNVLDHAHGRAEPVPARGAGQQLVPTDLAILAVLSRGGTLHDAAAELHLSHRTISRRVQHICAQLRVGRPIEAVVWAVRRGLL